MVKSYLCNNPECSLVNVRQSVVVAKLNGADPKVCPACGKQRQVDEQVNVSGKGNPKRNPPRRGFGGDR